MQIFRQRFFGIFPETLGFFRVFLNFSRKLSFIFFYYHNHYRIYIPTLRRVRREKRG